MCHQLVLYALEILDTLIKFTTTNTTTSYGQGGFLLYPWYALCYRKESLRDHTREGVKTILHDNQNQGSSLNIS